VRISTGRRHGLPRTALPSHSQRVEFFAASVTNFLLDSGDLPGGHVEGIVCECERTSLFVPVGCSWHGVEIGSVLVP
jgi:hypothetical protein